MKLGGLPRTARGPADHRARCGVSSPASPSRTSFEIQSDPIKWVNQDTQTVARHRDTPGDETGFESTLGVLVEANNVTRATGRRPHLRVPRGERGRPTVVHDSSSMVSTLSKIINFNDDVVPGAADGPTTSPPSSSVMPPDVRTRAGQRGPHCHPDSTSVSAPHHWRRTRFWSRLLDADLTDRIGALDLAADSILLRRSWPRRTSRRPRRPAGLAVVGVGLLENLSANRAVLTYLGPGHRPACGCCCGSEAYRGRSSPWFPCSSRSGLIVGDRRPARPHASARSPRSAGPS